MRTTTVVAGLTVTTDLRPGVRLDIVLVEVVLPVDPVVAPEDVDVVLEGNTGVQGTRTGDRAVGGQLVPAPRLLKFLYREWLYHVWLLLGFSIFNINIFIVFFVIHFLIISFYFL